MKRAKRQLKPSPLLNRRPGVVSQNVFVEGVTVTSPNVREAFMLRAARVKGERTRMREAIAGLPVPPLPVRITFTRHSSQLCDTDNLPTAAKAYRDELAAMYGTDDKPGGPIQWDYLQTKSARRGVRVEIEAIEFRLTGSTILRPNV